MHVLDKLWERHSAHLGELVRYADDLVVMSRTREACEEAEVRVRAVLARLKLELHPEKTRPVELSRGRQGCDFLGCHLRRRKYSASGTFGSTVVREALKADGSCSNASSLLIPCPSHELFISTPLRANLPREEPPRLRIVVALTDKPLEGRDKNQQR